jgi:hypothetical protein
MSWFPLAETFICLEADCAALFRMGHRRCPGCGSEYITSLAQWLDTENETVVLGGTP